MKIVVNTNRIIAALVKDGLSRKIITHFDAELITVGFGKKEIENHREEILKKARISEDSLDLVLEKLFQKLIVLDDRVIEGHLEEAEDIIGNIDKDDVPFIAAALATNCVIWSDDHHFKKQKRIEVYTTKELIERLGF